MSNLYYKAFMPDLTCQSYQFAVGNTYVSENPIRMCSSGFHCCENILNCLEYYGTDSRFCEVLIGEKSITEKGKTVTSRITLVREIVGDELKNLLTGKVTFFRGITLWYKDGKLHREGDLPAIERYNGTKEWFKEGKRHRGGDLPAIMEAGGLKKWYKEGQRHRGGDLPAVESAEYKEWWKEGKLHREGDLPAVEQDGYKAWFKHDKLHREGNLPAVEHANGDKEWLKEGKHYRENGLSVVEYTNGQ